MQVLSRSALLLAILFALTALAGGAGVAKAGASGTWSLAGSGMRSISTQIGLARSSDGVLHIVWSRGGAGASWALFDTTVSPDGNVGTPKVIASGWSRIDDTAAAARGKSVTVVFPGAKTDSTTDPTVGLDIARNAGGGWSLGTSAISGGKDFADVSVPALAQLEDGTLLQAWSANGNVVTRTGVDPAVSAKGGFGKGGNVALASGGASAWVGWCASGSSAGIFVRGVAPSSGAPSGALSRMPGSQTTRCPAATRAQLVTRSGGGVYVAASVSSERSVRVWKVGSTSVATVSTEDGIKQQIALAADPSGRLWVGWRDADSGRLVFRRSNPSATAWGAVVTVSPPAGQDGGVNNLDLAAQADRVDVVARTQKGGGTVSLFHTQMWPGLTVRATGTAGHVSVLVTDAGDPVAGSTVLVGGHSLRTGSDGLARIDLPAGKYPVVATKARYVQATAEVTLKGTP